MSSSASPDTSSDDDNINDARERFGRGANIYEETGKHSNALHDASLQGDLDTVQYLLDKGADINAQGGKYGTALQAASHQGNKSVMRELLHRGAKVNAQGGRYGNALQAASMGGHQEVLELLEKQLHIKQVISNAIDDLEVFHSNEDIKTIVCHMDLEVLACRKMDAEDMDDISRLVTFTGTSRQAQAATCVDYISPEYRMSTNSPPHLKLFLLSSDLVDTNTETSSDCWMPILRNSILACGFPSAPRTEGLGLEVPPAIMLYLAGVNYPTEWTTSSKSKGFIFRSDFRLDDDDISMLVPTQRLENAIQWHLVRTKGPRSTSIDKKNSNFINGMMDGTTEWYKTDDVDLLMHSRAFLGCWSQAEVLLGTTYFHTKVFGFSNLDDARRNMWISNQSSLTVGGNLPAGISSILRLGTMFSIPIGFQVRGPQRRVIDASQLGQQVLFQNASEQPLLLYDTAAKRAWMVAELSVALDMAHHFLASLKLDPSITSQLKYAKPSGNGGSAAYDAIDACKNVELWPDAMHEGKQMQFHNIISIFLTIFRQSIPLRLGLGTCPQRWHPPTRSIRAFAY
ncbi:hypothetical protein G7054_g9090 [Neopestalotiopsis clavispora]|nr:hypothetical protein G7054_g9090 [Neopestalotiopsis clavispora]